MDAKISQGFGGSIDSCGPLEKCDKAKIEYDDLSHVSNYTSPKSLCDILISFDGGSGIQWRGSWA